MITDGVDRRRFLRISAAAGMAGAGPFGAMVAMTNPVLDAHPGHAG